MPRLRPFKDLISTGVFLLAAITDWLDGLSGAQAEPVIGLWRIPRSGRRQADGGGRFDRAWSNWGAADAIIAFIIYRARNYHIRHCASDGATRREQGQSGLDAG